MIEPTEAFVWSDMGYLEQTEFTDTPQHEEIIAETGAMVDMIERARVVTLTSQLLQTTKDEIDVLKESTNGLYAVRYFGPANKPTTSTQYFCLYAGVITGGVQLTYQSGKRTMPIAIRALKDYSQTFDIPEYAVWEGAAAMDFSGLQLWLDPTLELNAETGAILDISGNHRHGTITPAADTAAIWVSGTPTYYLRFDGSDDLLTVGTDAYLNDDGTSDFMLEGWFRVLEADSVDTVFVAKTSDHDGNSAGWSLYRDSSNIPSFKLATGATSQIATCATTLLQNTWAHIACAVDRNGNATMYLNGALQVGSANVSALASCTNSEDVLFSADGQLLNDQIDAGAFRFHKWGAGGLPANIATIIANHYNAEKAKYGF
jgi:hypothetical protein